MRSQSSSSTVTAFGRTDPLKRGAPPPRPPTGPRSRRKSTGCRTAPASTRQLGIRRRLRPTPCPPTRRHGASASRREWGGGWCRFATSAPTTGSVVGSSGAGSWGFEGGRRSPCQAAVFNTAWAGLTTLEWLKPALTDLRHAPPGTARNSVHRAVAGKLLRLVATSLAGGEGESVRLGDGGDLSRAPLSTLPVCVPLRDGSSSILGDPTARQGALKGEETALFARKATQNAASRPGCIAGRMPRGFLPRAARIHDPCTCAWTGVVTKSGCPDPMVPCMSLKVTPVSPSATPCRWPPNSPGVSCSNSAIDSSSISTSR